MPDGLLIGVDIGGTKIAAGLVTADGEICSQQKTPMISREGPELALAAVVKAIDSLYLQLESPASLLGIGICAPGPLDPNTGVIVNPPNLPCWRNFPLSSEIGNRYGTLIKVDNDANAAALAEARWGAGRSYRNVFYATIGTGIGTGIILDGTIYHGRTGAAAEGGHVSIDYRGPRCSCGKLGCIEALAAGPAIANRARAHLSAGEGTSSAIFELAHGDLNAVTSEMVGSAYAAGDRMAAAILLETIDLLAVWIGNTIDLLEPDVIIIGGGAATMLGSLFDEIRDRLPGYCVNSRCQEIPILKARYGADAGIAGGAALCSAASGQAGSTTAPH
jgi:glucokinase